VQTSNYSRWWAATIVEAFRETCPRATDKAEHYCQVTEDEVVQLLAFRPQAWEAFKRIAHTCRRFPNCDPCNLLLACTHDQALVRAAVAGLTLGR